MTFDGTTYVRTIEGRFTLKQLEPEDIMKAMNVAIGEFTFFAAIRASAKRMLANLETTFQLWEAHKLTEISANKAHGKLSSDKSRSRVMIVENEEDYYTRKMQLSRAESVCDTLLAIVNGYDLQIRALQSILSTKRMEMQSNLSGFGGDDELLGNSRQRKLGDE